MRNHSKETIMTRLKKAGHLRCREDFDDDSDNNIFIY